MNVGENVGSTSHAESTNFCGAGWNDRKTRVSYTVPYTQRQFDLFLECTLD